MAATLAHIKSRGCSCRATRRRPRRGRRPRSRATRAPSWCGGCSSTRSTRTRPRSSPSTTSSTATSSPGASRAGRAGAGRASRPLAEISVFKLIEALDRVLQGARAAGGARGGARSADPLRRRCTASPDGSGAGERVTFLELFEGQRTRGAVVVTFLALLEMVQAAAGPHLTRPTGRGTIWVVRRGAGALAASTPEVDDVRTPEKPDEPAGRPGQARLQRGGGAPVSAPPAEARSSRTWSRRSIDERPAELGARSRSWCSGARRLSAERVRTVVESAALRRRQAADVDQLHEATGIERPRLRRRSTQLAGTHREGVSGDRPARGGRRLAAAHRPRTAASTCAGSSG